MILPTAGLYSTINPATTRSNIGGFPRFPIPFSKETPMERTLILIKPDGVERALVGPIISRFEQRGLKLAGLKLVQVSDQLARAHYAVHEGKPFFEPLIQYITSSPVVAMVLEGPEAIQAARSTIGATKPVEATPGSIRGDFGMMVGRNLVHGSDS